MTANKLISSFRSLRFYHSNKKCLGLWTEELSSDIKLQIERYWSNDVLKVCPNEKSSPAYYVLPMFPYPSGNLHMGHVRVYTISDTIARIQKLNGKNVIHPMGWDAFGLPAENAAVERGIAPEDWTKSNIQTMKTQLIQLGLDFDWKRELTTCDPQYYKWTQYIFIKLFEKGLAYQCKALVNWDPVDKTVLADEQVDDTGQSWRSGALVEKKLLTQWFIRTTKYAKMLYNGLNSKNLENWKDIINLQKHWIGECNGVIVNFSVLIDGRMESLDVWTSDPYKFIYGDFLTMRRSNILIKELTDQNLNKIKAFNPITNSELRIFISDDVEYPEGRDVYIASSSTDERDKQLAKSLGISYNNHHSPLNIQQENEKAINIAKTKNVGGYFVSSKLRDWLISRQRFWGTPIPMIHCPKCGTVPVPYEELPVKLPQRDSLEINNKPLSEIHDWVNCECPNCHSHAKRETDTMDTFVDSSWYYYRFLDPHNDKKPFDKSMVINNTPVDMYIGGKEHAVLHLYYARFMGYFLNSLGWTSSEEPFKKLLVQGMVMGQTFKLKSSAKYVPAENVEKVGNNYREKQTGEQVLAQWEKMSKSKYNGENPERLLTEYGCDTTRLLILADVPPGTSRNWSEATFPGVLNWQRRLWLTLRDFLKHRNDISNNNNNVLSDEQFNSYESKIFDSRNYFIATTGYHFKHTQKLSVGISRLQSLTNTLRNNLPPEIIAKSKEFELALASLIIMLSPVAPHFCSELWAGLQSAPGRICASTSWLNWNRQVLYQEWPKIDDEYKLSFLCKIDGADRCELKVTARQVANMSEDEALNMMLKENQVVKRIKRGISRISYEQYPECRAILHIYTNKKAEKVNTEVQCES